MARRDHEKEAEDLHEENHETEAGRLREDMSPPDAAIKKDGITSSYSTATEEAGKYDGEDSSDIEGGTGSVEDE